YWCYALGQYINGQLGNVLRPHWMIFTGLLVIAASNLLFALQTQLWVMAVFWGVNGFAQASGWGPMLRIISTYLDTEQRRRVSTLFSMSFQVGVAISWGLAGVLLLIGPWQVAFQVPAVLLILIAVLWRVTGLDADSDDAPAAGFSLSGLWAEMRHLFPMFTVAACMGFVYVGYLLWLPTFIQSWDFLPNAMVQGLTVIAPLVGIPGMWLAGVLLERQGNVLLTIGMFMVTLLLMLLASSLMTTAVQIVFVLVAMMLVSGLAGLILGSAPMLLVSQERVSSAGGLLTMAWSIAGGLAGTVVGAVAENYGWTSVFVLWLGITILAIGGVGYATRIQTRSNNHE
ncbi:MAG: MFS transporter, partial [Chloroflexota bacterium]